MKVRFERFTSLIWNINRCIQKIKCYEMEELGLKGNQVQCLFHLKVERKELSSSQLCLLCGEDKAAISRTIKELENKGLVYTAEIENRKYKKPIKLTEEGEKVAEKILAKIDDLFAMGSVGIQEKDREKFYAQLTKIYDNLTEICNNFGGNND